MRASTGFTDELAVLQLETVKSELQSIINTIESSEHSFSSLWEMIKENENTSIPHDILAAHAGALKAAQGPAASRVVEVERQTDEVRLAVSALTEDIDLLYRSRTQYRLEELERDLQKAKQNAGETAQRYEKECANIMKTVSSAVFHDAKEYDTVFSTLGYETQRRIADTVNTIANTGEILPGTEVVLDHIAKRCLEKAKVSDSPGEKGNEYKVHVWEDVTNFRVKYDPKYNTEVTLTVPRRDIQSFSMVSQPAIQNMNPRSLQYLIGMLSKAENSMMGFMHACENLKAPAKPIYTGLKKLPRIMQKAAEK